MLLKGSDDLTGSIIYKGITSFEELVAAVHTMPYVRTKTKTLAAPWLEQQGTCSSKHAFLRHVAELNDLPAVELILCMFKLSPVTHPAVATVFLDISLQYIPEAHCYLTIEGIPTDITFPGQSLLLDEEVILERKVVSADYIMKSKVAYHKAFIDRWLTTQAFSTTVAEVWEYRERCIAALVG